MERWVQKRERIGKKRERERLRTPGCESGVSNLLGKGGDRGRQRREREERIEERERSLGYRPVSHQCRTYWGKVETEGDRGEKERRG